VLVRADQLLQGAARSRAGRVAAQLALAVAVVVALVGSATVALTTRLPVPVATAAKTPVLFDPVPPAPQPPPVVAAATTLDVPRLGIHRSKLVDLGLDAAGVVIPPDSTAVAGWLTGSAVPGEVGPTVIAGHVDSYLGPGIFFRLDTLEAGDLVSVGRSDGVTVRFRVTDVVTVPKTDFPTDQVYGPSPAPELRLITCGGEFDHQARRYLRNVVVSAAYVDAS
jgi:LPXTG-site transpeptidase (sortase) family protein